MTMNQTATNADWPPSHLRFCNFTVCLQGLGDRADSFTEGNPAIATTWTAGLHLLAQLPTSEGCYFQLFFTVVGWSTVGGCQQATSATSNFFCFSSHKQHGFFGHTMENPHHGVRRIEQLQVWQKAQKDQKEVLRCYVHSRHGKRRPSDQSTSQLSQRCGNMTPLQVLHQSCLLFLELSNSILQHSMNWGIKPNSCGLSDEFDWS